MKATLEKLNDATARIERVIFLAGAMASIDAFGRDLNDFLDEEDTETIEKLLGKIPDWIDLEERPHQRAESVFEWLKEAGKMGFLVQFATPVMTPSGKNSRTYSWGYYNTEWIYAETIDQAIAKGLTWVKKRRASEDRKAKEKKAVSA